MEMMPPLWRRAGASMFSPAMPRSPTSRPLPGFGAIALVAASFYCLSQAQKTIPLGVGYAIWSGVGILAITAIGWIGFRQRLDVPAMLGMGLILAGVLIIRLFSRAEA